MAFSVCYLERCDRGGHVTGVRLLGPRLDRSWTAPSVPDPEEAARRAVSSAAEWIASELKEAGLRGLDTLCIDTDGGVWTWINTPSADSTTVRAMLDSAGVTDEFAPETGIASQGRFPAMLEETSLDIVPPSNQGGASAERSTRCAVLAQPDVPARLLIDELDKLGVAVGSAISFWHATAAAWDPGARREGRDDGALISAGASVTGVVLLESGGRAIWTWSEEGRVIAGGSVRMPLASDGELMLDDQAIARLTTEWLSWSAQRGLSPTRIICVGPSSDAGGGSMSLAAFSAGIGRRWSDATVDVIEDPDAVGATLRAMSIDGPARSKENQSAAATTLTELTARPSRAHKSMYTWCALAVFAAAGVVGALAYGLLSGRAELLRQEASVKQMQNAIILERRPELVGDPFIEASLQALIDQRTRSGAGGANPFEDAPPIMQEVETLSLVLGNTDIELREFSVGTATISIRAIVDDTEMFEALAQSIQGISGSQVLWRQSARPSGNRIEATFTGVWTEEATSDEGGEG